VESESKKKIMIVASVVCFVVAVIVIAVWLMPANNYQGFENESFWIMCRNPNCNHTWQMNAEAFLKYQMDNANPQDPLHAALAACPKCGEKTGDRAYKCPKCQTVFFPGSVVDEKYTDRCPKCGYSESEEQIEAAKASRDK
jgi:hypothetical protein